MRPASFIPMLVLCAAAVILALSCETPGGGPNPSPSPSPNPDVVIEPVLGEVLNQARDDAPAPLAADASPLPSDPAPASASPAPASAKPVVRDPAPVPVDPPVASAQPAAQAPVEPPAAAAPIQVSKELFNQTFSEVELLIKNLNNLIRSRDYQAWLTHLSPAYIAQMSAPEYLRQLSQSATLMNRNIVLRSLQDYFIYVVVPSRANLRLDDLVFLSENVVEAIMIVGNRRVTVYRLIKVNSQWMIGLS